MSSDDAKRIVASETWEARNGYLWKNPGFTQHWGFSEDAKARARIAACAPEALRWMAKKAAEAKRCPECNDSMCNEGCELHDILVKAGLR